MGRLEKLKRQLIEEANKRLLKETIIDDLEFDISDNYSEYGTDIISIANKFSGGGYQWGGDIWCLYTTIP